MMTWAKGREGTHEAVSNADRRGKPLRTVICMETGLVRNDPVPDDVELAQFYAQEYRIAYKGAAKPRRRQVLRNFRRAATYVRTFRDVLDGATRILDVGRRFRRVRLPDDAARQDSHGNRTQYRICRLLS